MARLLRRYNSPLYGSYLKCSVVYGAISGGVLFVFVTLSYLLGSQVSSPETYVTDILLAICIFAASYYYREHETGGRIYLRELLIVGMLTGLVAGVVYGLSLLLYGGVIDGEFVSRCIDARVAQMPAEADAANVDEAFQYRQAIDMTRKYGLADWAFIGGFRTAVMSIIIAFFSAIIFKTEQNQLKTDNKKN